MIIVKYHVQLIGPVNCLSVISRTFFVKYLSALFCFMFTSGGGFSKNFQETFQVSSAQLRYKTKAVTQRFICTFIVLHFLLLLPGRMGDVKISSGGGLFSDSDTDGLEGCVVLRQYVDSHSNIPWRF